MKTLLIVIALSIPSIGQAMFFASGDQYTLQIPFIDDLHDAAAGTICTSTKVTTTPPDWSWNCDTGTPNCSASVGPICGNSFAVTSPSLDGHAREMDFTWGCPGGGTCTTNFGGYNFHVDENATATGNLDSTDTTFTWKGSYYYTDLSKINQVELDLYQSVTSTEVLIFAAQCDFTRGTGTWSFSNGWTLLSNVPCPKANWTANTWHTIAINVNRCALFVHLSPCTANYNWVAFDGTTIFCTLNCSHDSRVVQTFSPVGLLLQNVQLDMSFTGAGSMTTYADQMITTASP
jgi:hypothetical protein